MARKSVSANERFESERGRIEAELERYKLLIRELRDSDESRLLKTKKQKEYHSHVLRLKSELEHLN